jgi:hypothetical protein
MVKNVNTISFGPSQQDLQAQQLELQKRQQYADTLRAQSMAPIDQQVVSGRVVPNSPWLGLTKLATAYLARKEEDGLSGKQAEIGQEAAKRQAQALRSLAPAGIFDEGATEPQAEGSGFTPPKVAPELRQKWLQALAAFQVNPELGGKRIQELNKEPEFATTPQYDQQGNAFVLNNRGDVKRLDGVRARDKLENVNGRFINPYSQTEGALAPQDVNQPFMQGESGPVPNAPYQQYAMSKARAGAPSVSVNTATKPFLNEIGKGAGEAVNAAFTGAQSAVSTLQNVDQIRQGLGNAILGPTANARVTLAQIGESLGVTGKDTTEQLQNTRNVMQGLARQELSAAGQMKGQGQITESERAILRKAESGQISEMTAPEIKTLLTALERTANYRIGLHQANMQRLSKDPNMQGVIDYMQVSAPQQQSPQPAKPAVRRYNPQTGMIE